MHESSPRTASCGAPRSAALSFAVIGLAVVVAGCSVSEGWNDWFTPGDTGAFASEVGEDGLVPSDSAAGPGAAQTRTRTQEALASAGDPASLGRMMPRGYRELTAAEAAEALDHFEVVDVREPQELVGPLGQLPGVRNIPLSSLPSRLGDIPDSRPLLVVCRSGNRSGQACAWVAERTGRPCAHIGGGMIAMQRRAQVVTSTTGGR